MTSTSTSTSWARAKASVVLLCAVVALPACSDRTGNEPTRADVDAAAAKTRDAAISAGRKAAELADKARDQTVEFANSPKVRHEAAEAKETVRELLTPKPAPSDPPPTRP